MFVGHLAVALLAKRPSPSVSLGWFVAAATTLDLLWPLFVLAGWERVRIVPGASAFTPLVFDSYPWSHSLLMAVVWAAVLAGLGLWRGVDRRAALLIAALVVSHWVAVYLRERRAHGWLGRVAFWSLILVSTVMWVAGPWSPPPSSARELAWFALIGWIMIPWAAWADQYYSTRSAA